MIKEKKFVKELWSKLVQLPSVAITYKDGQEILWIMLRKEDYEEVAEQVYNELSKQKKKVKGE